MYKYMYVSVYRHIYNKCVFGRITAPASRVSKARATCDHVAVYTFVWGRGYAGSSANYVESTYTHTLTRTHSPIPFPHVYVL